jgi:hypothetical protein
MKIRPEKFGRGGSRRSDVTEAWVGIHRPFSEKCLALKLDYPLGIHLVEAVDSTMDHSGKEQQDGNKK